MDLSPWLTRRRAYEAVAGGRPDDAHRLLAPLLDDGNWKAWRAAREVAKGYCARAHTALDADAIGAAWRDLLAAESLNTGERRVVELRQTLARFGLVKARAALEAGDPRAALEAAARLRERGVRHPDLPPVEEAARDWLAAAARADGGDFLPALDDLHRVRAKIPAPPTGLDRFRDAVAARHARLLDAFARAQEATAARRWADAVAAADDALAAAPDYHPARTLRTRAWEAAYPGAAATAAPDAYAATDSYHAAAPAPHPPAATTLAVRGSRLSARSITFDTAAHMPDPATAGDSAAGLPKRFFLWVDGVAGFLVCTGPRVTFGQAVLGGGPVDIPLFADVSRVHAELARDDEGYVVEAGKAAPVDGTDAARAVRVNGRPVGRAVLAPGDRLTLGATCQFVFRRPVAVSATAALELTSGHRLMLPVEGVLLMANELILGPPPEAHVAVPAGAGRVLLYRSKDGLGVKVPGGACRVNDRPFPADAPLPFPASVETADLTFTIEPVGPRL